MIRLESEYAAVERLGLGDPTFAVVMHAGLQQGSHVLGHS